METKVRIIAALFSFVVLANPSAALAEGAGQFSGTWGSGGSGLVRGPKNIWRPYGPAYYAPTYFYDAATNGWYVFDPDSRQWVWYPN
jgi:hypothetical protein